LGAELLLILEKHGKYFLGNELIERLGALVLHDKVEIDLFLLYFYVRLPENNTGFEKKAGIITIRIPFGALDARWRGIALAKILF